MKLEEDQKYIWTEEVAEGTMKTTFRVEEKNTWPFTLDERPLHYMCKILKVTIDGEDKTEEYLEKAFDGEQTRGVLEEKLQDIEIEEVEEK